MIVYYSATGNSRFAAQYLAQALQDDCLDAFGYIKHGIMADLITGKPWVFVCPVYAWRMPRLFRAFLQSASLQGAQQAYFVFTCGSDIGNAPAELPALCAALQLQYMGAAPLVMPENYIARFAVPTQAQARRQLQEALAPLGGIAAAVAARQMLPTPPAGVLARLKSGPVHAFFCRYMNGDKAFYTTDACTRCGACAQVCPANNIRLQQSGPQWMGQCTHCMACIGACPARAIEYGRITRGKQPYRCPQI